MNGGEPMRELDPDQLSQGVVGRNVSIRCLRFESAGTFKIGDGVELEAEIIRLGDGAEIGSGTSVRAIRERTELLSIGDQALLDENCNVMVPRFECGDYTRIFRNALISGYKPVTLGHNCWVGQGAILNSAETLTIGNNVRMGGSQIWTHVASGEVLEGSRFYGEAPVIIEDDVWLMGFGHLISPGVTLARGTVVMASSVVSKSTEAYHTYSGIPARDVTDKLPAWDRPTPDEKWKKLRGFVQEFVAAQAPASGRVALVDDAAGLRNALAEEVSHLIFARQVDDWDAVELSGHSVFDLATKTYWKQRTPLEIAWHHFALGFRARFLPRNASKTSGSETPAN